MKASRERLNDPPSETWERPYQGSIDAMILVADDDPRYLERVVGELLQGVLEIRPELSLERGKVLRNDEGDSIEHFGYVDGISQPIFFETSQGSERDTRVPLKDVLVEEPGGIGKSYGSYLVFRKLEQDVSKFRCLTRKLVRGLRGDRDAPSSPDEAGALVVGRSLDGTPRIEPPAKSRNDFRFDGEKNPPTHAHIRKTNPRDDSEKRIVRRGVPYGERTNESLRWDGFVAPPSKGVGLLFLCFQSDIGGQFEWIQERANDPDAGGLDPIIGQLPPGQVAADAEATRQEWGTHRRTISFHGVVKLRGGEYFFAPSVSFLQELAAAPTGSTRA